MISKHGSGKNAFYTDSRYWDCGCFKSYIHPKSLKFCPKCKCHQEDYPDSKVNEVNEMLKEKQ
jgi:hypothetical protein